MAIEENLLLVLFGFNKNDEIFFSILVFVIKEPKIVVI